MSVGYAPGNGHSGSSCLLARAQKSSESSPHRACGDMSVDLGMYSGIKAQQGRGWPGKMAWRHHRGACWCARLCHAWDPGAPRSEHPAPRRCWVLVPPRLPRQRCRLVPSKARRTQFFPDGKQDFTRILCVVGRPWGGYRARSWVHFGPRFVVFAQPVGIDNDASYSKGTTSVFGTDG